MKIHQEKIKNNFDRKVKEEQFHIEYLVLNWDAPREDKHGKFDHMSRRSLYHCNIQR